MRKMLSKVRFREHYKAIFPKYRMLILLALLAAIHVVIYQSTRRPYKPREFGAMATVRREATQARWIPGLFQNWRKSFIETASLRDDTGLVSGIFLGETSRVKEEHYFLFKDAGLLHVLAASGFNCWIVAMLFYFCAASALRIAAYCRLSSAAYLWFRKTLRPWSFLIGGTLFFLWSDQSPPITRALVLIITRFMFWKLDMDAPFWRILFVHYALSLLCLPSLWFNASFQLTYSCIAGMLLANEARKRITDSRNAVVDYFAVTLGANLGATPITLLFFEEANFTGLYTNAIANPIVSLVIMPLALISMFLVSTPIAGPILTVASWAVKLLIWLLEATLDFVPALQYFR